MKKQDYSILAAAIKKHGFDNVYDFSSMDGPAAAELCARKIASTFAHFAHVEKQAFLKSCGVE